MQKGNNPIAAQSIFLWQRCKLKRGISFRMDNPITGALNGFAYTNPFGFEHRNSIKNTTVFFKLGASCRKKFDKNGFD
jgi:hypothetical protein